MHLVFGCAMSLLSAVIFAFDNVLSEVVMSHPSAPDPKDAAVKMGTIATLIFAVYLVRVWRMSGCWYLDWTLCLILTDYRAVVVHVPELARACE